MSESVFGKCERCGRGGYDSDAEAACSGYHLEKYEGMDLCRLCVIYLNDRKHDEVVQDQINQDQRDLSAMGFQN